MIGCTRTAVVRTLTRVSKQEGVIPSTLTRGRSCLSSCNTLQLINSNPQRRYASSVQNMLFTQNLNGEAISRDVLQRVEEWSTTSQGKPDNIVETVCTKL